ncbi:hypothetical protein HOP50_10g58250 [Chloropicon primus]|nr:hypothetical protein HOP50_10g58250 [Chloropicon primus]
MTEEISLVDSDFKVKDVEVMVKLKGQDLREVILGSLEFGEEGSAEDSKVSILLDFYSFLVNFSRQNNFTVEKASCFLNVAKRVHDSSVDQVLTVENSLSLLKDLLLKHSVHRPPYSVGVFTLKELQLITEYMIETYYKHYNLYQFVYVKEFCMTAMQTHPCDSIETPQLPLTPLVEALTEKEHLKKLEEERLAKEEEERQKKLEEEEKERAAKEALKDVECTEEVSDVIAKTVNKHVAILEEEMKKKFQEREEELLKKIEELQMKAK